MNQITFMDLLNAYFKFRMLRPATVWSYRKTVASLRKFAGDNILPEQINQNLVVDWREHIIYGELQSKVTWNNKVTHMRALFNFAYDRNILPREKNPFNGVSVRPDKKKKKTLTKEQVRQIYLRMEALESGEKDIPLSARRNALRPAWFWLTAIDALKCTGMRQNQLLHIRLCDVNFVQNWISLRPEGSKNHKEHRVPITAGLRPRLERLYRRSLERGAGMEDRLFRVTRFVGGKKTEVSANYDHPPLRAFFRRLSRDCGFKISPHRFRHTIATNLMRKPDRNIKIVQDLLGHSTVTVTLEYVEADLKEVKNVLEELEAA